MNDVGCPRRLSSFLPDSSCGLSLFAGQQAAASATDAAAFDSFAAFCYAISADRFGMLLFPAIGTLGFSVRAASQDLVELVFEITPCVQVVAC